MDWHIGGKKNQREKLQGEGHPLKLKPYISEPELQDLFFPAVL